MTTNYLWAQQLASKTGVELARMAAASLKRQRQLVEFAAISNAAGFPKRALHQLEIARIEASYHRHILEAAKGTFYADLEASKAA